MQTVIYVGNADVRVIKDAQIVAEGFTSTGSDLVWSKSNNFRLDVPDDIALWLINAAQYDFLLASGQTPGQFADMFAIPQGTWQANTQYPKNAVVTYNGGVYRTPIALTTGLTFNPNNWEQWGTSTGRALVLTMIFGD